MSSDKPVEIRDRALTLIGGSGQSAVDSQKSPMVTRETTAPSNPDPTLISSYVGYFAWKMATKTMG